MPPSPRAGTGRAAGSAPATHTPFQLPGTPYARRGYEWWWHHFSGERLRDGAPRPFFIEYKVMNPGLVGAALTGPLEADALVAGQGTAAAAPRPPAYAKVIAGTWGAEGKKQLHAYYPLGAFRAARDHLHVEIGPNLRDERRLVGAVEIGPRDAACAERMSDAGAMRWDLTVACRLDFPLGWASARPLQRLGALDMLWHVPGMRADFEGHVTLDGEAYRVRPETSFGYCDKNWGRSYTDPWIWLSCNRLRQPGATDWLADSSLVFGGGTPSVWGRGLGRHVLVALRHQGHLDTWNFTTRPGHIAQDADVEDLGDTLRWRLSTRSPDCHLEALFDCAKADMLSLGIVDPLGRRTHPRLYNGGHARGHVTLHRRAPGGWRRCVELEGEMAACEYGRRAT